MRGKFIVFVPAVAKWLVVAPSVMVFAVLLLLHVLVKKSVISLLLRLLWSGPVAFFMFLFLCSIIWIPGAKVVYHFQNEAECDRVEDIFLDCRSYSFLGFSSLRVNVYTMVLGVSNNSVREVVFSRPQFTCLLSKDFQVRQVLAAKKKLGISGGVVDFNDSGWVSAKRKGEMVSFASIAGSILLGLIPLLVLICCLGAAIFAYFSPEV